MLQQLFRFYICQNKNRIEMLFQVQSPLKGSHWLKCKNVYLNALEMV